MLWGKDENGQNERQKGYIKMITKSGTWDHLPNETSLESLMESPAFSENSIRSLTHVPYKNYRANFDREETLKKCPDGLKATFIRLFRDIDELDLKIGWYEWDHKKRKSPPRAELLARFTPEEAESLHTLSTLYDDLSYLRAKRELVELRRSQYPLRDTYQEVPTYFLTPIFDSDVPRLNGEWAIFPLGVKGDARVTQKIWTRPGEFTPLAFSEDELKGISDFIWDKEKEHTRAKETNCLFLDFGEPKHLENLVKYYDELEALAATEEEDHDIDSSVRAILDTFNWYCESATLKRQERIAIEGRRKHLSNIEIQQLILEGTGHQYSENYVSTLYTRAIKRICAMVEYHKAMIERVFFVEEFKVCPVCKRIFLRDDTFFNKDSRSRDGLARRCKFCTNKEGKKWSDFCDYWEN